MNLKIKIVIVGTAVLSMTSLQVQAGVIDASTMPIDNDPQRISTEVKSGSRWPDFDKIFYPPLAFSAITAALTNSSFRTAQNSESTLLPRTTHLISGLRG